MHAHRTMRWTILRPPRCRGELLPPHDAGSNDRHIQDKHAGSVTQMCGENAISRPMVDGSSCSRKCCPPALRCVGGKAGARCAMGACGGAAAPDRIRRAIHAQCRMASETSRTSPVARPASRTVPGARWRIAEARCGVRWLKPSALGGAQPLQIYSTVFGIHDCQNAGSAETHSFAGLVQHGRTANTFASGPAATAFESTSSRVRAAITTKRV